MALLGLGTCAASGQLAITEVMSCAATNLGPLQVIAGSDFWELTNFGTNSIDLADYEFADNKDTPRIPLVGPDEPPLWLGANQSVIFVRNDTTTSEPQFRDWWGSCLPTEVPVRFFDQPGLSSLGDEIRLYDRTGTLVDRAVFGVARRGVSFVYDPSSGEFGTYSLAGECGACLAATADDLASPGTTCGPVPLRIREQPTDVKDVCTGTEATFWVRVDGLPRPRCQWFFNGSEIPGATGASYTITNVHPADAGKYHVCLTNGLTGLCSTSATLSVNLSFSRPRVILPPTDLEVYVGQPARFLVTVCAYPLPSYQWFSNSVPIVGATNRLLRLPDCRLDMSDGLYSVRITNLLGSTNASARLTVIRKPKLQLTEAMCFPFPMCPGHHDWFELTNLGTNAVNLRGYRFLDEYTLPPAKQITNTVIIYPGESVIFAERMTPEMFASWWGADSLPPGLKVITYGGFGLKYTGFELYLWNAAAEEEWDTVEAKGFVGSPPGVSYYIPLGEEFDQPSEAGQAGAFHAEVCDDIGSPGYTANPRPRFVEISRDGAEVTLRWRAVEGKTYWLKYKNGLGEAGWTTLGSYVATRSVLTATDLTAGGAPQRYYWIEERP